MTDEEELLARLGIPTCVFCGELKRSERNSFIHAIDHKGNFISGEPCSSSCEKEAQDRLTMLKLNIELLANR